MSRQLPQNADQAVASVLAVKPFNRALHDLHRKQ